MIKMVRNVKVMFMHNIQFCSSPNSNNVVTIKKYKAGDTDIVYAVDSVKVEDITRVHRLKFKDDIRLLFEKNFVVCTLGNRHVVSKDDVIVCDCSNCSHYNMPECVYELHKGKEDAFINNCSQWNHSARERAAGGIIGKDTHEKVSVDTANDIMRMAKQIDILAKPLVDFVRSNLDKYNEIRVDEDGVHLLTHEMTVPFDKTTMMTGKQVDACIADKKGVD
jgi:hypothetical protein